MLNLIKLELRQNRLKTFILATLAISACMLGFVYLFACIPHLKAKSELEEMVMGLINGLFGNYENIIALICILCMFCFSVLSSAMMSRFVVSDYSGKRANLLFAYPINRPKLFCAKVILVFVFTVLASTICNILIFGIFFFAESVSPLVEGGILSVNLIENTLIVTLIFSILAGAIGLISLWFGFVRKSVIATLIPSYILAAVFSNILGSAMLLGNTQGNITLQTAITSMALIAGVILVYGLAHKVNVMEAL